MSTRDRNGKGILTKLTRMAPPSGYRNENSVLLRIPYVFGSSRPRDLSYLDTLPPKLRVYNTKLGTCNRNKDEPTLKDYLRELRAGLTASPNHTTRDRSVDSASRFYVFGSSTPRDLSYLDRLPWEFRIYDVKLGRESGKYDARSKTTSFSSASSAGTSRRGRQRTSSLNLNRSPSANGKSKRERKSRSPRSISRPAAAKSTKPKLSPVDKVQNSCSTSTASRGSAQKVGKSKPKLVNTNKTKKESPLSMPLNVQCPTTPSSTLPSQEPNTFDGLSPMSDEFYIVPALLLKSDTNVGLNDAAPSKMVENIEEYGSIRFGTESIEESSGIIVENEIRYQSEQGSEFGNGHNIMIKSKIDHPPENEHFDPNLVDNLKLAQTKTSNLNGPEIQNPIEKLNDENPKEEMDLSHPLTNGQNHPAYLDEYAQKMVNLLFYNSANGLEEFGWNGN